MLLAATIYNLSHQLDPKEFGRLMDMYDRDRKPAAREALQGAPLPTLEETIERLLAGPMRQKKSPIHKTNNTPSRTLKPRPGRAR